MHELGIAQEIVELVRERTGEARVSRVVVEVGTLVAVLPDALRFCFELAAEGTSIEGAALDVVEVLGRARCRACDATCTLDRPFGRCACGSSEFEWLAGEELVVRSVEVS